MPIWLIVVLSIPSFFSAIALLVRLFDAISSRMGRGGLIVAVLDDATLKCTRGHARLRVINASTKPFVVSKATFRMKLTSCTPLHRLLMWPQLVIGHLINDVNGLNAVMGYKYSDFKPRWMWIRRPLNIVIGLTMAGMVLSMSYSPIGWLFLLLIDPYYDLYLLANNDQIELTESVAGRPRTRPLLVTSATEQEFDVRFNFYTKAKFFPKESKARHASAVPPLSWSRLPRVSEAVWKGKAQLLLNIHGGWRARRVPLGSQLVVMLPPQGKGE